MENIDSSKMEVLSEFASGNSELDGYLTFRLGIFGDNFIISGLSTRSKNPLAFIIPEDATDRVKMVSKYQIERGFWRTRIFFELKNFNAVLERIEEVYGVRKAKEKKDFNDFDIKAGKDLIAIEKNSVMPNNVAKPVVTLMISNQREGHLDLLEMGGFTIYVAPETGLKMMDEMQKIKPIIEKRLNN